MERILIQLLEGQQQLAARFDRLEQRFDNMEKRLDGMEKRLDGVERRLDNLETRIDGIRAQLSETTQLTKALWHRSEEADAQIHNLSHMLTQMQGRLVKTATKNDIDRLAEDINFIMKKVADHDTAILRLSRRAE
ncbi:hypothetical protein [Sporolituus thermophilus]|uniref:Uncharacterized protein n=1 Tax=Sporolituus thermophilus DSM 23256 TaxID=1123285 RepID=A0A1G7NF45_9FIRM|nr:hypothetical protein [Sporolituus thermophilus]SDF72551.1 hypothetical protein SAMN05660235_02539 [Sporolituus thermophilus DSM 23256]